MAVLDALRAGANFAGLPTTKDEEWKYTSLAEITRRAFRPVDGPGTVATVPELAGLESAPRLVFVDGFFASALSRLPEGVVSGSILSAASDGLGEIAMASANPLVALNAARAQDGAFLRIPKDVALATPIRLVFLASPGAKDRSIHPRNRILVERGAKALILEEWRDAGAGTYFSNPVTEIDVAPNASLTHVKIQDESEEAFHIASVQARQGRDAKFVQFSFSFGSRLSRNDIGIRLDGTNGESHLNGLYLGRDKQVIDHHTVVDHAVPHCRSDELYKGVLGDEARGIFNGKIFVRKDAQKTDAIQSNKALLLSKTARVDTKPQLEIFADDVRCTHGATIGQLDEIARFYLRTRGIPDAEARRILVHAFARDVADRLDDERIRAAITARVETILTGLD